MHHKYKVIPQTLINLILSNSKRGQISMLISHTMKEPLCFCFVILSLSDNYQTVIIEAFNCTSRYLDDLLNIDNPYFEQMVGQIYPTEISVK